MAAETARRLGPHLAATYHRQVLERGRASHQGGLRRGNRAHVQARRGADAGTPLRDPRHGRHARGSGRHGSDHRRALYRPGGDPVVTSPTEERPTREGTPRPRTQERDVAAFSTCVDEASALDAARVLVRVDLPRRRATRVGPAVDDGHAFAEVRGLCARLLAGGTGSDHHQVERLGRHGRAGYDPSTSVG